MASTTARSFEPGATRTEAATGWSERSHRAAPSLPADLGTVTSVNRPASTLTESRPLGANFPFGPTTWTPTRAVDVLGLTSINVRVPGPAGIPATTWSRLRRRRRFQRVGAAEDSRGRVEGGDGERSTAAFDAHGEIRLTGREVAQVDPSDRERLDDDALGVDRVDLALRAPERDVGDGRMTTTGW